MHRVSTRPALRRLLLESLEPRQLLAGDLIRSYDGQGNNLANPDWGAANTQLLRLSSIEYEDGISEPAGGILGTGRANPRAVSNRVADQQVNGQVQSIVNDRQLTSFVFQWGQFLDHDMDLTEEARNPLEPFMIPVADDDPHLNEGFIPVLRSRFDASTGTGLDNPRQQINQITSYIDGSNVYGSDEHKAHGLRLGYGGFLLTSDGTTNGGPDGEFLPFNYEYEGEFLENATPPPFTPDQLFIAGDVRANEQPGLTALHTLFVREHNYQARQLAEAWYPGVPAEELTDEQDERIYQAARAIVGAELQAITYYEFLPALLGPDQLASYQGYDQEVNASIANIFSAALYRVGHTMLPNELLRLDDNPLTDDNLPLGDAFFDPNLTTDFGIEPYLKGLAVQNIQEIDSKVIDGVRNLLFDPPAQFDLVATNMQRGRDHGLPDYNQALVDFGLDPIQSFSEISSDPDVALALEEAYGGDIDNVDVWMAAVSADHIPGGSVGLLMQTVLVDQFTRLRDGDRFYFENVFRGQKLNEILNTRLSDIVLRNTTLTDVQDEVFRDESVLVYRAPAGAGRANVRLQVADGQVEVVDNGDRVLAAKPLADTSRVVIFGTSLPDRISIDASAAESLTVPVELHGGGGSYDTLHVAGTDAADQMIVQPTVIQLNGLALYYGDFERLTVEGQGGEDTMTASGAIEAMLVMDGGDGDDIMRSEQAPVVLLGGNGNDSLFGGSGRDILVGGNDQDLLSGGGGQDILIGGRVSFGADSMAWDMAQMIWGSNLRYQQQTRLLRMTLFRTRGFMRTVFDDGAVDTLLGGADRDWFLVRPGLDWPGDRQSGEQIV